jgi:peptidoglycan/LPS O-acetylase OafA/YrhL
MSILLVVAFHAGLDRFAGGYAGVDVFFVLSGYLITGLLLREVERTGRIALGDFYARRARRLLPLSALVLLATTALGVWLLPPLSRVGLIEDVRAAALYFANWRFAAQATAYSDAEVTDTLVLHYWSLSVEEQFYVLWPLLIIATVWSCRNRSLAVTRRALGLVITTLIVVSFAASVTLSPRIGPAAYYATHTRLWEMAAGAALALWLPGRDLGTPRLRSIAAATGLLVIVGAALTYDAATIFPGWAAAVPVIGTLLLLSAGGGAGTVVTRALGSGPLPTLGRWSYAWYLWHWPLIGVARLANERYGTPLDEGVATAIAVAASLGLAAASHYLVENPIRNAASLRSGVKPSIVLGVSLTLLPVAVGGAYASVGDLGSRTVVAGTSAEEPSDASRISGTTWAGFEPPAGPMSPADAVADTVPLEDPGCHIEQATPTARIDCVFGDPDGDATIMLYGDSHALHWLPAIDAIGERRGWRVINATKSACSPIDVRTWNPSFEREYVECEAWRESLFDQLRGTARLDAVILARSQGQGGGVLDGSGNRLERRDIAQVWAEGAARTFNDLQTVTDKVVVLRDTPWAPEDIPTCLSAATSVDDCTVPLHQNAGRDVAMYAAERSVAHEGVYFVDPTHLVCDEDPCSMVTSDGTIKYRDRHHLTRDFALQLAPRLDAILPQEVRALGAASPRIVGGG